MAKITELAGASALAGTEEFPLVQGGATKRASFLQFLAWLLPLLPEWLKGEPGAAGNVAANILQLKAAPLDNRTMLFAGVPFSWETERAPYTSDEHKPFVTVVESDHTPASIGAWVRQESDAVTFDGRSVSDKLKEVISVTDKRFAGGAKADGSDDWPAFNAALVAAANVVSFGGTNAAVGAEVVVPYRSAGYILGQTLVIPPGVRLRFASGRQVVTKTHSSVMYLMKDGSQIDGGDHRGGMLASLPGNAFRLESVSSGQGRQRISNLRAATNWQDEVLYYEISGGSQSVVQNCILATNSGKFAVKVEDGFKNIAVPRKLHNIETNGTPGFDFGGCNDMMVSDSFCGGVRFTMDSRGVHMSGVRIANQTTVEIKGHNHVLSGGWNPRPTFKSEPDFNGNPAITDLVVWNAYCNSGRPIDKSGVSRNNINFPEYPIAPVLRSDNTALTLASFRNDWGIKRSGATYTFRLDLSCDLTGGAAAPGGLDFGFLYIDLPDGAGNWGAEQIVQGLMMEYTVGGTQYARPVVVRILPQVDATTPGTRAQFFDMNLAPITGSQAPGGVSTPGWKLNRIRGQISYSPA